MTDRAIYDKRMHQPLHQTIQEQWLDFWLGTDPTEYPTPCIAKYPIPCPTKHPPPTSIKHPTASPTKNPTPSHTIIQHLL